MVLATDIYLRKRNNSYCINLKWEFMDRTVHDHAPEVIYPGYIISNLHPFSSKSEIPWELQLKYCEIDGSGLSCFWTFKIRLQNRLFFFCYYMPWFFGFCSSSGYGCSCDGDGGG
ncbi:unnamed protein product [Rhizophagus irregularis]|nr:unnamed protein product [Rhizophagus irregularis]